MRQGSEGRALRRCLQIARLLDARPITTAELYAISGCHRNAMRDLARLRDAGEPIVWDRKTRSYRYARKISISRLADLPARNPVDRAVDARWNALRLGGL